MDSDLSVFDYITRTTVNALMFINVSVIIAGVDKGNVRASCKMMPVPEDKGVNAMKRQFHNNVTKSQVNTFCIVSSKLLKINTHYYRCNNYVFSKLHF